MGSLWDRQKIERKSDFPILQVDSSILNSSANVRQICVPIKVTLQTESHMSTMFYVRSKIMFFSEPVNCYGSHKDIINMISYA